MRAVCPYTTSDVTTQRRTPMGHVKEYPTMHHFRIPIRTQSMTAYMIWTVQLWELHCGNVGNMPYRTILSRIINKSCVCMFLPSQALQGLLQGVVAGNANTASNAARTMKSLQQGNNKSSAAVAARSGVTFSAKLPGKFSLLLT